MNTSETINSNITIAAPTNTSGEVGIPGCNYLLQGDEQGCANVNCGNCRGTYIGLLTTIQRNDVYYRLRSGLLNLRFSCLSYADHQAVHHPTHPEYLADTSCVSLV